MCDSGQESLTNGPNEERTIIREKLSSLSFEELIKLKEEMGSKLYNDTIFGASEKNRKKEFKRVNKNRPREISSKLRQKQIHQVLTPKVPVTLKKAVPRDPRFDPLCGQYDDKTFKDNYKFVTNIREEEKKQLEIELKKCTDSERKKTFKFLIQRMDNQIREQKKNEIENKKKYEEKIEVREKLKNGERPIFKKKSVKKLESLIEKFEHLKKTNRLQKHMEKKSKKLSSRDRKKLDQQLL